MRNDEIRRSLYVSTSDLPLAVTLVALGFTLVSLDLTNPSRVSFQFQETDGIQQAVTCYWGGNLTVEPKAFWNIQRELKARIRNEIEAQKNK